MTKTEEAEAVFEQMTGKVQCRRCLDWFTLKNNETTSEPIYCTWDCYWAHFKKLQEWGRQ